MKTRATNKWSPVLATACMALLSLMAHAGQEEWLMDFK